MTAVIKSLLLTFGLFFLLQTSAAALNPLGSACGSNAVANNSATCKQAANQGASNPISGPNGIINTAANIIALVAGIAAVIIIIISGFMFITAGGARPGQRSSDPNKVKTARAALTGAITGLVVIALAWAIIKFVTTKLIQ